MQKIPSRRNFPLPDRTIEVIDDTLTGEVLLDEALKMMKSSEKMSVSSWIDLMSGMCRYRSPSYSGVATLTNSCGGTKTRRDMEPYEDRLPAQAGP